MNMIFPSMAATERTDGARRRILDEKRIRGAAQTGAQAVRTFDDFFERKSMDFKTLHTVLAENFAGNEPLRLHFLNAHPKYGNADAGVDALVAVVVERIKRECARHKMAPQESHFVPGAFCWIMHEQLGRVCGATPDGPKAGFPFADGGGPAQGCERNGPTSAIVERTGKGQ